jgi:hypothetical protein
MNDKTHLKLVRPLGTDSTAHEDLPMEAEITITEEIARSIYRAATALGALGASSITLPLPSSFVVIGDDLEDDDAREEWPAEMAFDHRVIVLKDTFTMAYDDETLSDRPVDTRRASAFLTPHGVFYCLFETGFKARELEPNPQTRCVAFGSYEQILAWIFGAMANCTTGFLRGLNGPIDPADYWRFWAHALRRPDFQFDQPIWLKAGREAGSTIPVASDVLYNGNRVPFVVQQLEACGYPDTAVRVGRGEEVVMSLHRDALVLSKVFSGLMGADMEPWRIVRPEGRGEGSCIKRRQQDPAISFPLPGRRGAGGYPGQRAHQGDIP